MNVEQFPQIIQGGMGVGVSNWRLARAVAEQGCMGVVSGTALDAVLARRLQQGDPKGDLRRALGQFPWPEMAQRVQEAYFKPGGKREGDPFRSLGPLDADLPRARLELLIVANFVEVYLAKEGHDGPVGVNYLEKIQIPTLPSLFGAMLAGVDYVLVGAGIPMAIPGMLDELAQWNPVELKLQVEDNPERHEFRQRFDPNDFVEGDRPELMRPRFLAIISSDIVARTMIRRASGAVDGFIVEGHTAGGHNAPPRRAGREEDGVEPKFGEKDIPNLEKVKALGRPFWLAGGHASPDALREALELGAAGIQVGTAFALCDESGIVPEIKREALEQEMAGTLEVRTDFRASPTGYPFKLAALAGTMADPETGAKRSRVCDLGFLRELYHKGEKEIGYRCPGEPVGSYVKKGGGAEKTEGCLCLCNGLLATIGLGQARRGGAEAPIVTSGEDLGFVPHVIEPATGQYGARRVIEYLRGQGEGAAAHPASSGLFSLSVSDD